MSMLVSKLSVLDESGEGRSNTDSRNHLSRRAWTLQECSLARRLLLYSGNEVFWHCQQKSSMSTHPSYAGRPDALSPINMNRTFRRVSETQLSPDWLRYWFKVVEDYTRRQMSDPADSLNALAGMANQLGAMTGQRYIHGLWDKFLPEGLLWRSFSTALPTRWSPSSSVVDTNHLPGSRAGAGLVRTALYGWIWASISSVVPQSLYRKRRGRLWVLCSCVE